VYALKKEVGWIAFATKRLAAGANVVPNMVVWAWLDSADTPVGYPMATRELFGAD
jgi:hypothetical protein